MSVKCPCCKEKTLRIRDEYEICCNCNWEDDGTPEGMFSDCNFGTMDDYRKNVGKGVNVLDNNDKSLLHTSMAKYLLCQANVLQGRDIELHDISIESFEISVFGIRIVIKVGNKEEIFNLKAMKNE